MPHSGKNVEIHQGICIYEISLQAVFSNPALLSCHRTVAGLPYMVLGDACQQKHRSAGGDVEDRNKNDWRLEKVGQICIRKAGHVSAPIVGQ